MKIKKLVITAFMAAILSIAAFQTTAFAAEDDPNSFIPGGTGTVVENVVEKNGKEFYTIRTEAGNIFYLIVDRNREDNNVYFLNAVTEADLMALAEKSGTPIDKSANPGESKGGDKSTQQSPEQEKSPTQGGLDSNTTTMIFVGIAVAVFGLIGFYFKIVRPKKHGKKSDDDFDEYEEEADDDYDDDSDDDDSEEEPD